MCYVVVIYDHVSQFFLAYTCVRPNFADKARPGPPQPQNGTWWDLSLPNEPPHNVGRTFMQDTTFSFCFLLKIGLCLRTASSSPCLRSTNLAIVATTSQKHIGDCAPPQKTRHTIFYEVEKSKTAVHISFPCPHFVFHSSRAVESCGEQNQVNKSLPRLKVASHQSTRPRSRSLSAVQLPAVDPHRTRDSDRSMSIHLTR